MKKLLLGITVLAFVLVATSAMAAGLKPPKAVCFTIGGNIFQLGTKAIANVPSSVGTTKMYSVMGSIYIGQRGPVNGSGYVAPGTTTFHATFSAELGATEGLQTLAAYEWSYDLATQTGVMYNRYDWSDGSITLYGPRSTTVVDCSTLSIPSALTSSQLDTDIANR
jgi:hypothetical protein